jgi:hypothetical protein
MDEGHELHLVFPYDQIQIVICPIVILLQVL